MCLSLASIIPGVQLSSLLSVSKTLRGVLIHNQYMRFTRNNVATCNLMGQMFKIAVSVLRDFSKNFRASGPFSQHWQKACTWREKHPIEAREPPESIIPRVEFNQH